MAEIFKNVVKSVVGQLFRWHINEIFPPKKNVGLEAKNNQFSHVMIERL
jgi:hypothetical protein